MKKAEQKLDCFHGRETQNVLELFYSIVKDTDRYHEAYEDLLLMKEMKTRVNEESLIKL